MSLMPHPFDEKNYKVLREKFNGSTICGKVQQTFRSAYNLSNGQAADSIEKMCNIDAIPTCKFLFDVKFDCTDCGNYQHDIESDEFLICYNCGLGPKFSFSIKNLGVKVQADFELGLEKPYQPIISISKENKKLGNSDIILRSFDLTDPMPTGCAYWFYGIVEPITFVLKINNIELDDVVLPKQPKCPSLNARLAEKFSETCMSTTAPPGPLVDVTLHVEGKKIYGHKVILSLGSKYFERMFESTMKEAKKNEVYLEEIDFNTLKCLLEFLYSDTIDETNITLELLEAADRFEVMRLMEICCENLYKTINSENVAQIFEVSYRHSIVELTHDCIIYMAKRWKSLLKDEKVFQLTKKYGDLGTTVSALLAENDANCT
jgi:hypothetical protein